MASVFPSGVQEEDILDINYDHNTAILNLSDHFYEAVGPLSDTAETQLVYGMVNALTDHGRHQQGGVAAKWTDQRFDE